MLNNEGMPMHKGPALGLNFDSENVASRVAGRMDEMWMSKVLTATR
jgi:hypothetical protein